MDNNMQRQIPLASHTTLKVGGPAAYFTTVKSEAEAVEVAAYAREHTLPLRVIGSGSNLLVPDEGFDGLVIHMANKGIEVTQTGDTVFLTAAAGETLDNVIAYAVEAGYWGLENLSHIPGTVGAAPVQNVGAYGVEIGELVCLVRVLDTSTGSFVVLDAAACHFGYRDSCFKTNEGRRFIITAVTFSLTKTPTPRIAYADLAKQFETDVAPSLAEIRNAIIAIRSTKFPDWHTLGTAGSFFKNPTISLTRYQKLLKKFPELPCYKIDRTKVKLPLGWILDRVLSLRGYRKGNVGLSETQALVLINYGGATASEIDTFTRDIQARIKKATGIKVEWEVQRLQNET